MRTIALLLTATAAFLLLAPDASARGWSFEDYLRQKAKSEWEAFGVGTMIHTKSSQKVTMPGAPEPQISGTEEKKTLVQITETHCVLKVEKLLGDEWIESEKREARDKGLTSTVEDAGTGSVKVGETTYECAMKKVVWKKGEEVNETTTLWIHPEKGILKMKAESQQVVELTVTKIDASWKVGDQAIEGREIAMKVQTARGMELTGEACMSVDVPDSVVKHSMSGTQGPVEVKLETEMLGFVKK